MDIHGQREHPCLLKPANQTRVPTGHATADAIAEQFRQAWHQWQQFQLQSDETTRNKLRRLQMLEL